jgi:hypothetical protein
METLPLLDRAGRGLAEEAGEKLIKRSILAKHKRLAEEAGEKLIKRSILAKHKTEKARRTGVQRAKFPTGRQDQPAWPGALTTYQPAWPARAASSSKATMLVILIIGLTAGPAVSL